MSLLGRGPDCYHTQRQRGISNPYDVRGLQVAENCWHPALTSILICAYATFEYSTNNRGKQSERSFCDSHRAYLQDCNRGHRNKRS